VAVNAAAEGQYQPLHPLREFWIYFRTNRGALAGMVVILVVCLLALFANVISPYSPIEQYPDCQLAPPIWQDRDPADFAQCVGHYYLGTDPAGRDMFSRLVFGARFSLLIGAIVVTICLAAGIGLGLLAGFFNGFRHLWILDHRVWGSGPPRALFFSSRLGIGDGHQNQGAAAQQTKRQDQSKSHLQLVHTHGFQNSFHNG